MLGKWLCEAYYVAQCFMKVGDPEETYEYYLPHYHDFNLAFTVVSKVLLLGLFNVFTHPMEYGCVIQKT